MLISKNVQSSIPNLFIHTLLCWEGLGAGGEGDDRGWDGWMASPTRWTWVSVNSGSWWWTGRPGVLRFMGSQRVGYNWATELNWNYFVSFSEIQNLFPCMSYFFFCYILDFVFEKLFWKYFEDYNNAGLLRWH